jgi:hypothetical protein
VFFPGQGTQRYAQIIEQTKSKQKMTLTKLERNRRNVEADLRQYDMSTAIMPFNEKDISDILTRGEAAPVTEAAKTGVETVQSVFDIDAKLAKAKYASDVDEIAAEAEDAIRRGAIEDYQAVYDKIKAARERLAGGITMDRLQVGTLVRTFAFKGKSNKQVMGNIRMSVIKKDATGVTLRPVFGAAPGSEVHISPDELPMAIEGIIDEPVQKTVTPEENGVGTTNISKVLSPEEMEKLMNQKPEEPPLPDEPKC